MLSRSLPGRGDCARAAFTTELDHFRELIAIDDPLKRRFYTELCRVERWSTSTRALKSKMDGLLFERTAIASRPHAVVESAAACTASCTSPRATTRI